MGKDNEGTYNLGSSDDNDLLDNSVVKPDAEKTGKQKDNAIKLLYRIDQSPPWYLSIALGFQHYLTMFGATIGVPFVLSEPLCFANNPVVLSQIINTIFFASGLATLIQTTIGVRLPIVQGGTYTFIAPTFAIMGARGKCPGAVSAATATPVASNTSLSSAVVTAALNATASLANNTMPSQPQEEEWKLRMRVVQGAIMVSALFQVLIGFSGIMGMVMRYIGPLTIVPTITLVGLPLFDVAYNFAGVQWGVAIMMMFLVTLFSQVLKEYNVPFPVYTADGWSVKRFPLFKLFPILLAIVVAWIFSAILTVSGAFTDDPKSVEYKARTDAKLFVLREVSWFRVPYPGQWGTPTVEAAAVFGMLAGVLASMIESVGDYYACARLSGAPPPPRHAVNRGIGMEGIGCILTGAWGTGNGTTSYSENIGAIGITRVGSLRVIQAGGAIMMLLAVLGKFGALFTTIPDPVIGGIFTIMFSMITAVGLSSLQFVDLNSVRNLFVLGNSLFFGMVLPFWIKSRSNPINTGVSEIDQILTVLLSTNMAVGGITGFVLDNLLPGTDEERGLLSWRSLYQADDKVQTNVASIHIYDIPFITKLTNKFKFVKYIPFLPYYEEEITVANNFAKTTYL